MFPFGTTSPSFLKVYNKYSENSNGAVLFSLFLTDDKITERGHNLWKKKRHLQVAASGVW
jgi:hypothetical protein